MAPKTSKVRHLHATQWQNLKPQSCYCALLGVASPITPIEWSKYLFTAEHTILATRELGLLLGISFDLANVILGCPDFGLGAPCLIESTMDFTLKSIFLEVANNWNPTLQEEI